LPTQTTVLIFQCCFDPSQKLRRDLFLALDFADVGLSDAQATRELFLGNVGFHASQGGQVIDVIFQHERQVPTDWSTADLSYEVYDRFVAKRDPEHEPIVDPNLVLRELTACMKVSGGVYSVNFTRRLMEQKWHSGAHSRVATHSPRTGASPASPWRSTAISSRVCSRWPPHGSQHANSLPPMEHLRWRSRVLCGHLGRVFW